MPAGIDACLSGIKPIFHSQHCVNNIGEMRIKPKSNLVNKPILIPTSSVLAFRETEKRTDVAWEASRGGIGAEKELGKGISTMESPAASLAELDVRSRHATVRLHDWVQRSSMADGSGSRTDQRGGVFGFDDYEVGLTRCGPHGWEAAHNGARRSCPRRRSWG